MSAGLVAAVAGAMINIIVVIYGYGRLTERVKALNDVVVGIQQDIRDLRQLIMGKQDKP